MELLNCHKEKLHGATILNTTINGNAHQDFFNQQNVLRLHPERAGGVLHVHKCARFVVHVIKNSFCTKGVPVSVCFDNSSEGI